MTPTYAQLKQFKHDALIAFFSRKDGVTDDIERYNALCEVEDALYAKESRQDALEASQAN